MSWTKRLLAVLLAVVVPPAGVALLPRRRVQLILSLVLCLGALVVFWFAFALPGVLLWAVGILHALCVVVFLGAAKSPAVR